jgi:toxin ParE1/3/4
LAALGFAEIRACIAADNPDAAQRIGSKLRGSIGSLEQFPNLGKLGRVFSTREMSTSRIGNIYVEYRIEREEIQILRVLPGMRDIDAVLEEGFSDEEN